MGFLDKTGLEHFYGLLKSKFEKSANKVTVVDESSDDDHYPTAKAVYDAVSSTGGNQPFQIQTGTITVQGNVSANTVVNR